MVETVTKSLHHSCRSELHASHRFRWHRLYLYLTSNVFHCFNIRYQRVVALIDLSVNFNGQETPPSRSNINLNQSLRGHVDFPRYYPPARCGVGLHRYELEYKQERIAPFRGKIVLPDKEFRSLYIRWLSPPSGLYLHPLCFIRSWRIASA
jgi:hypothetical protein